MNKLLLISLLYLTGCATSIAPVNERYVPQERVMITTAPAAGLSTLVVVRDQGIFGSGCYLGFWINQTLAARVGPKETVTLHVPSGQAVLEVTLDPQGRGLCSPKAFGTDVHHQAFGDQSSQREFTLTANETQTYRIRLIPGTGFDIMRIQ